MGADLVDLKAWRSGARLAAEVLRAPRRLRGPCADSAATQMVRAAESIPANVAEAYGRGFGPDGARLLRIARASAVELESHLRVASLSSRLPEAETARLASLTRRTRALIDGLVRSADRRKGS